MHTEGSARLLMLDIAKRHNGQHAQLHMNLDSNVPDDPQLHDAASV